MEAKIAEVKANCQRIREEITRATLQSGRAVEDVRFMAVTKTVDSELVNVAIAEGITLLGENRVQEYQSKRDAYTKGVEVQFIGSLQTNKVKYLIGNVSMIQSVDRPELAKEIHRIAQRHELVQDILLEVNIGEESTKSGTTAEGVYVLLEEIQRYSNIRVRGLMTIPPPCDDDRFLQQMKEVYDRTKKRFEGIEILSMGMSDDYVRAILCGSNLVRIGSALFGTRVYTK